MIDIVVHGTAAPAGSKRAFPFKKKKGQLGVRVTDANPNSAAWKQEVAHAAKQAYSGDLLAGPLWLTVAFTLPRPKYHYGTGKNAGKLKPSAPRFHDKKPDATKLLRGIEDALTGIVWRDDAQVCAQVVTKMYGEAAKAEISIGVMETGNERLKRHGADRADVDVLLTATSKDNVSITSDGDETVIMSGRLWLIYHEIGTAVVDATDEADTDVEELMKDIRRNSHKIAEAILRARAIT